MFVCVIIRNAVTSVITSTVFALAWVNPQTPKIYNFVEIAILFVRLLTPRDIKSKIYYNFNIRRCDF